MVLDRAMPKVIRDPIWDDIKVTDEEVKIIDSPDFQRLDGIKQLGLAFLVYRGARHTRFLHSIGSLAAAQCMIGSMQEEGKEKFDEETVRTIRMVALLHDIGHVPFAHLLEDEAGLYSPRHDQADRIRPILEGLPKVIPHEAYEILLGKVPGDRFFIQDFVSNTVCADLIDYIRRDGYFSGATGLRFTFDRRMLGFFKRVPDKDGRSRLALEPTKDKIRQDVITDLLQLLRYRYILTERVTYHHAKLAASAMLIKAVTALGPPPLSVLAKMSDDEFLRYLVEHDDGEKKITSNLVWKLVNRQLHKPVFRLTRRAVSKVMTVEEFATRYGSPEGRVELEKEILDAVSTSIQSRKIDEGDIVLYTSPDHRMTFKATSVLVRWKGDRAMPLRDVPAEEYWETTLQEEIQALEAKYGSLWTAGVFIDPSIRDLAYEIERACERVFGMENDPLLRRALAKEPGYSDMVLAQDIVEDLGLARAAVTLSQKTNANLTREARLRQAVEEIVRSKGRVPSSKASTLEGFENESQG